MSQETKILNRQQIQDALEKNFTRLGGKGGMGRGRRGGGGAGGPTFGSVSFSVQTRYANLAAPSSRSSAKFSASRPCRPVTLR